MKGGADVVVVGGGIIGCAAAYELARRGARVTLIERSELAAGASGRNHGLLLAPLDTALVPMARASAAAYEEVAEHAPLPVRLDPRPIGMLIVAGDGEDEREEARVEAEAAAACGVAVERIEGPALHQLEPALGDGAALGWLLDDGRRLDPAAMTVAFALLAKGHGAIVRRHLTVRGLLADGDRVRGVATDEGLVESGHVVVAAGPWSAGLLRPLGIHLPVTGARGWLVHLAPDRLPVRRLVGGAGWHSVPDRDPPSPVLASDLAATGPEAQLGAMVQPNRDGTVLLGGSRQTAIAPEPDDPEVPRRIVRRAVRLVPALAGAPVLGSWWGIRPMTPDGRPVVGRLGDGLVVATGHGSQGVILGAGTAGLVAATVLGEAPPFDPGPFDPARFVT